MATMFVLSLLFGPWVGCLSLEYARRESWYDQARELHSPYSGRWAHYPWWSNVRPDERSRAIAMLSDMPVVALTSAESFAFVGAPPPGDDNRSPYLMRAVVAEWPVT